MGDVGLDERFARFEAEVPATFRPAPLAELAAQARRRGRLRRMLFAGVLAVAVGVPVGAVAVAAGHDGRPSPFPPPVVRSLRPSALARPDQYVFIERRYGTSGGWIEEQSWASVDGTHAGMGRTRTVGTDAWKVTGAGCAEYGPLGPTPRLCVPPPSYGLPYQADMPTTGDTMLAYLKHRFAFADPSGDVNGGVMFNSVMLMLEGSYLTPASMSALVDALKEMPGLWVGADAVDALGRPGIAINFTFPLDQQAGELMFDANAHEYHGFRYVYRQDGDGHRKGDAADNQTVRVRQAIVDRVGQVP